MGIVFGVRVYTVSGGFECYCYYVSLGYILEIVGGVVFLGGVEVIGSWCVLVLISG